MDMGNSAHEAPRRGSAYGPTGFRRLTPGLIKVDRIAEGFSGLPEGVTVHGQLLAAFKAAAPRLGLATRLVHAVDWLFRFTQPQDWGRGGRPIVWPSALLQQEALGVSETQAKRVNRYLIELGLITMKDSPNGKRYGRRDARGRIVEAYGFDLSPLAARYQEFVQLAEEGRAEREAMGRLRRRATIARKGIVQILETARDYDLRGEEWPTLEREARAIVQELKRADRPDDMEAGVVSLEQRQQEARSRLEMLLKDVKKTPLQPENAPHQYTYKPTPYPEQDTVITPTTSSEAPELPGFFIRPAGSAKTPGEGERARDPPRRISQACPTVKALSASSQPNLVGNHRCRGLAAARSRCLETIMGRCLPGDGPGSGRGRVGDCFDQGPRALPNDAGRVFPRHGAKGQSRRTASRANRLGDAPRGSAEPAATSGQGRGPISG